MAKRSVAEAIAGSLDRMHKGKDCHRQHLDRYLPAKGLIGEFGSAGGRVATFYQNAERKFIAIDIDEETIREAKRLWPDVDFRCADAFKAGLPDECLDAYVGLGIFELDGVGGKVGAAEAYRMLKPGGLLYLTLTYKNLRRRLGGGSDYFGLTVPTWSEEEARALLEPLGFRIDSVRRVSLAHGLHPFGKVFGKLLPSVFDAEREDSLLYKMLAPLFRPLANSMLIIAYKDGKA